MEREGGHSREAGEGCRGGGHGARQQSWGGDTLTPGFTHPYPCRPILALCTASSVSKDVCLFLEQRFISFHFNCLLLSWACESASLCYKGEARPCGPNVAASFVTNSILWLTGYDWGMSRKDFTILWSLVGSHVVGQEVPDSLLLADLLCDLEQVLSTLWASGFLLLF